MVLLEEFQAVIQEAGGRLVGEGYYGVWDGFPFTAYIEKLRKPGIVSFDFRLAIPLSKWLLRELQKELPKGCRLTARPGLHYELLCKGRALRLCEKQLAEILDRLTRSLRQVRISPPENCPLCRQKECDAYADLDGYVMVHRDCVEAMTGKYRRHTEEEASGSWAAGFLGAVLGGLVVAAAVLGVLALGWTEIWFLYVFLPLGASWGYQLFRKGTVQGALGCTCAVSVFYLLLLEQAIFYIFLHVHFDIWPSVLESFLHYWEVLTVGEMLSNLWPPALALALGLWISWRRLHGTAQGGWQAVSHIRATLCDMREDEF